MIRTLIVLLLALALAGCAGTNYRAPNTSIVNKTGRPIGSAAFCDVMAANGGPVMWSRNDTRITKEQISRLNAVWKKCPQYRAIIKAKLPPKPEPQPPPMKTPPVTLPAPTGPAPPTTLPAPVPGPSPPLTWPIKPEPLPAIPPAAEQQAK